MTDNTNALDVISACTAFIHAQQLSGAKPIPAKLAADMHMRRGLAYTWIFDFERAIADYEKALPQIPGAQAHIDKLQIRLNWLRYLKEIQDDHDYANWSGPPLDRQWQGK